MNVVIGGDHTGFELKATIVPFIGSLGHTIVDVGCFDAGTTDFIPIIRDMAEKVRTGAADRGIVFCGTGAAEAMAINKIPGIRAAVCHDIQCAHQSVEHDDANIMVLGSSVIGSWVAKDLAQSFLDASFFGREDFKSRLVQLAEMEEPWSD